MNFNAIVLPSFSIRYIFVFILFLNPMPIAKSSNLRNVMVFESKQKRYSCLVSSICSFRYAHNRKCEWCPQYNVKYPCFLVLYSVFLGGNRAREWHDMITWCELTICLVCLDYLLCRDRLCVPCACYDSQYLLPVYLLTWPLIVD